MKLFTLKKLFAAASICSLIISAGAAHAHKKHKDDSNEDKVKTHIVTQNIKWQPTDFGPEVWSVAGDFSKGQHITYVKFPAGTVTPLHIHSSDYVGVVLTGTTRHWIPGEKSTYKLLPPTSHWSIPADVEHVTECLPGVECVLALYQDEAFDFIPLGDAPKRKRKKGHH